MDPREQARRSGLQRLEEFQRKKAARKRAQEAQERDERDPDDAFGNEEAKQGVEQTGMERVVEEGGGEEEDLNVQLRRVMQERDALKENFAHLKGRVSNLEEVLSQKVKDSVASYEERKQMEQQVFGMMNETHESPVEKFVRGLEAKENVIRQLEGQVLDLEEKNHRSSTLLEKQKEEMDGLRRSMDKTSEEMSQLKMELERSKQEAEEYRNLAAKNSEMPSDRSEDGSRSSTEAQWTEEIEKLRSNLSQSQNEVAELHEKLRIAVKKGKHVEEKKKILEATLQEEVSKYTSELEQLKKDLHNAQEEADGKQDLAFEVERLTKELGVQRAASSNLEEAVGQITHELSKTKSSLEESMQNVEDLTHDLDSKERQLQEMLNKNMDSELLAKDDEIRALQDQISQLTSEQETMQANHEANIELSKRELERLRLESDAERNRLLEELDDKNKEILRQEENFKKNAIEFADSQNSAGELQRLVLDQERTLEDMKKKVQFLSEENEELKRELEDAVKKGQKTQKEREEMETKLGSAALELEQLREKHKEVQEKSANLSQMLERLESVEQENLALKGSQSESLQAALNSLEFLQSRVTEIEGELHEQNQALSIAREETELLLKQNSELQELRAEAEAREEEAKSFLQEERARNQSLQINSEEIHSMYQSLQEQLSDAEEYKRKVDEDVCSLKQELFARNCRCSELESLVEEKEQQTESMRVKLEEITDSTKNAEGIVKDLETKCASQDAVILDLENTCKELSERAREYKDQLKAAVRKGKTLEKQKNDAEEQLQGIADLQERAASADSARESAVQELEKLQVEHQKLQQKFPAVLEENQKLIDELSKQSEEVRLEAKNWERAYETLVEEKKKEKLELEEKIAKLAAATEAQEALEEKHAKESVSLNKQLLELQAELEERTASFNPSAHEEQLRSLEKELEDARLSLEHHEADAKVLREKLRAAVKKGKSIEKEKMGLEEKVINLQTEISHLETNRNSARSDLEETLDNLESARNDLTSKETQISELEEVVRSSYVALETLRSQYAELEAHLPEVSRLSELESELSHALAKINELEQVVQEKEGQISEIQRESQNDMNARVEVESLKAEKGALHEKLQDTESQLQELSAERHSLLQELDMQKRSTEEQKEEYESLMQELNLKSNELLEAQDRAAELEVQVLQLQDLSNSSTKDTEDLASQHAELLDLLEERERELHNATERLDSLASELADRDAELAEVQSQAEEAFALRSKALADSQTSAASLSSALERTEQLSQALEGAKSEFDRQLASVNEDYRTRLDKLMNDYTNVQQKLASVEALAEDKLSARVEDFKAKAGAAEGKNKILEQELQQLKQALQMYQEREQSTVAAKPFIGDGDANSAGPFQRRSSRPYDPEANTSSNYADDGDFKPFTGVRGYQVSRLPPSLQQWVGTVDRYSILSCVTFRREPVLRVLLMVYLVVVHVMLFLYFSIRSLR